MQRNEARTRAILWFLSLLILFNSAAVFAKDKTQYPQLVPPPPPAEVTLPIHPANYGNGGVLNPAIDPYAGGSKLTIEKPKANEKQNPKIPLFTDQPALQDAPVEGEDVEANTGKVTADYILGPGDMMQILDFSMGEVSNPYQSPMQPILPDGSLNLHPIGIIKAAGLTLGQLTKLVNERAKRYLLSPDIQILVSKVRPNTVYILGEVLKPGLYTNEAAGSAGSELTVATTANLTVTSALQRAGGIKESADVRQIRVTRLNSPAPATVDLWKLLVEGDTSQDIAIQSGDVIFVPKGGVDYDPDALGLAANQHRRVRVLGAVQQPGLMEMSPDDDVISVIAKSGGFTKTAVKRWVLLSRLNRDGTIVTRKISINRAIRHPDTIARSHVKPGDLIIVADSIWKKGATAFYNACLAVGVGTALAFTSTLISTALTTTTTGTGSTTPSAGTATISVFSATGH